MACVRAQLKRSIPLYARSRGDRPAPRAVENATQSSTAVPDAVPPVSLGIDLGTTNSVAAVVTAEYGPSVVPYAKKSGKWALPSFVTWTAEKVVVGDGAKRQASINPADTFYSVKRLVGQEFEDVKDVGSLDLSLAGLVFLSCACGLESS